MFPSILIPIPHTQLKGEIELAQDSLQAFESCDATLHKTKKLYQQSCDHVTKLQGKLEKTKTDPNANPKAKQQVSLSMYACRGDRTFVNQCLVAFQSSDLLP